MTKLRDPKVSLHDILECANNCIGFTKDMSFEEYGADIKTVSAVLHQIMIIGEAAKRLGTTKEIGAAAVYLVSDEAAYITGQTINLNGGMLFS